VLWCTEAKKALAFPKNSLSFSSSRTRRRNAAISASSSRGSGRPSRAACRSRSSVTHRPTTDSPSPQSRATDAIRGPCIQHQTRHITTILRRQTTTSSPNRHLTGRRHTHPLNEVPTTQAQPQLRSSSLLATDENANTTHQTRNT